MGEYEYKGLPFWEYNEQKGFDGMDEAMRKQLDARREAEKKAPPARVNDFTEKFADRISLISTNFSVSRRVAEAASDCIPALLKIQKLFTFLPGQPGFNKEEENVRSCGKANSICSAVTDQDARLAVLLSKSPRNAEAIANLIERFIGYARHADVLIEDCTEAFRRLRGLQRKLDGR